jgi:hypothetical protein
MTIDDSRMPWGPFFLAAGASNIGQAIMFHYSGIPSLSAATLLGRIGKNVPKPSSATWGTVLIAGGVYCYVSRATASRLGGGGGGMIVVIAV